METVQNQQIESLLKTATEEQLDVLKQSLSHFSEVKPALLGKDGVSPRGRYDSSGVQIIQSNFVPVPDADTKNQHQTIGADEDDYIEEDFEEDNDGSEEQIDDAIESSESESVEERLLRERREKMERERKEKERVAALKNVKKPSRPISATYDLSNNLVSQQNQGGGST